MRLTLIVIVLLTLLPAISRAADDLPRGTVIESVKIASSPEQTYALYLPSGYTPAKKWSVLYAFDPLARGKLPVTLFSAAAEKYGYIVVGSNNSRNGLSPIAIVQIITTLWRATHERLSLNDSRVYATGFSGGARVANRFAATCGGCIAGVISCGAGFPPDIAPSSSLAYAFFGTVGVDDFNFREMQPLERKLDTLGITSRLVTFDGRHQWCPEAICSEGLEWMELQAMRRGSRAKDDMMIDAVLSRLNAQIERLRRPEDADERYAALRAIVVTFDGLRDVARYRAEAEALKSTKEFRKAMADEERQLADERNVSREVIEAGGGLLNGETHDVALARVRTLLDPLRERSKLTNDSAERRVARRALAGIYAQTYEAALYIYEPQKKFNLAVVNLELAVEVFPASAPLEFELARALALDGHRDKALASLTRAVEKGFQDTAAIEREEAFAPLRSDTKYKKLFDRMKAEPTGDSNGRKKL